MRRVFAITLLLSMVLSVFAATHYFIDKEGEIEAFLKLDIKKQEIDLSLEMSGTKDNFSGLYKNGKGDLVNIDSTSTLKLEFKERLGELRIQKDEAEIIFKEIALEYVENRKLNRLSSEIKYPKFLSKEEFSEQVEQDYSNYFEKMEKEFWLEGENYMLKEPEFFIGYEIILSAELETYQSDLISISFMDYRYTGGAHGNYSFTGLNYLWLNNELKFLKLEDIISENYLVDLSRLCISKLKALKAAEVLKGNRKEFNKEDLSFFSFNQTGMTFYFAPYVLDCYAAGDFKVHIPWQDLKSYLAESSALDRFIK